MEWTTLVLILWVLNVVSLTILSIRRYKKYADQSWTRAEMQARQWFLWYIGLIMALPWGMRAYLDSVHPAQLATVVPTTRIERFIRGVLSGFAAVVLFTATVWLFAALSGQFFTNLNQWRFLYYVTAHGDELTLLSMHELVGLVMATMLCTAIYLLERKRGVLDRYTNGVGLLHYMFWFAAVLLVFIINALRVIGAMLILAVILGPTVVLTWLYGRFNEKRRDTPQGTRDDQEEITEEIKPVH